MVLVAIHTGMLVHFQLRAPLAPIAKSYASSPERTYVIDSKITTCDLAVTRQAAALSHSPASDVSGYRAGCFDGATPFHHPCHPRGMIEQGW